MAQDQTPPPTVKATTPEATVTPEVLQHMYLRKELSDTIKARDSFRHQLQTTQRTLAETHLLSRAEKAESLVGLLAQDRDAWKAMALKLSSDA